MNAERLLAHYAKIADAPTAIPRLRRFVLDLAMRGKLVPQNRNDEPASELLKRIMADKERLSKASAIGKQDPLPPLAHEEIPFELPKSWTWVRLGAVSQFVTSGSRDWAKYYSTKGAIFVRMGNLSKDHYQLRLDQIQRIQPPADGEGTRTRLEAGDILISITGDVGMLGLIPDGFGEAYINQHTAMVRPMPEMKGHYLPELFRSSFAQDQFKEPQRGIKNSFRLTDVTQFVVPLPPLPEQHRIVAKVDELMALCDRLEAARADREATRDRLTAASFARLNTPDPDTFRNDACFALDALPALSARADQIKQLRQCILNLAVCGMLVPQDPNEGTGNDLLRMLSQLRAQARSTGRGRTGFIEREVTREERYLDVPPSWAWLRICDAGFTQTGTTPSSSNSELFGRYVPFVKPADLNGSNITYDDSGLSEKGMAHSRVAQANTVLMVCIGASLGKVNITDRTICFNQQINSVTPYVDGIQRFIALALKASKFQELAWSKAGTGTLPILSKAKWEALPIPFPPLAEQHRIVAKVDELMVLCDRLEAGVAAADETRCRLLDALLAEALEPNEERELEAAE